MLECERHNRRAAENRAEETDWPKLWHRSGWHRRKADWSMVQFARMLAWPWVTSSTLVSVQESFGRIPFERVSDNDVPDACAYFKNFGV